MSFFDRVKAKVKLKKTTIKGLLLTAFGGEISIDTYNGWKKRKDLPGANHVVKIAQTLGTTVEYLVTGEEIKVPGLSPEAFEIARAADKLNDEGKKAALGAVEGLQKVYPLGDSILSNKKIN
jgi:hypothetical protein